MKIKENPDKEVVKMVREGLKAKDGYCPCRLGKDEDNKCICKEFREQIKDPSFEGFCHCMLYYKSLED
jgi:ferredoxin-thioredoxin reductase catalytic subunit